MLIDKEDFKARFVEKLETMQGQTLEEASRLDKYMALSSVIKDYISKKWAETNKEYMQKDVKQVYYFSVEFLMGRLLGTNILNTDVYQVCAKGLMELGIDINELEEQESDAGLGNGGLGRLAACFLDSMASLSIPGHGCGIRYKYGLFEQKIMNGYQVELPDNWLKNGNVWEIRKPDKAVIVKFGGKVKEEVVNGRKCFVQENCEVVQAVPYDVPIVGYHNNTVNTLRLWSAEAATDFDLTTFNRGDHLKAIEYKYAVESISEILYPDDTYSEGRKLRLKQEYFFVSAGIQSIVRRYKKKHGDMNGFDEKISIHINDTHPALAVPELMRILLDEEGLTWDKAWEITSKTISYTNHTVLPEALEKWPISLMSELLPRIYMIIHEINEDFCAALWKKYPGEWDKIAGMAIIAYDYVHMAHLAVVGSAYVNGVAEIHTEILKKQVMNSFYQIYPYKFTNKTNGITHRRWLMKANPGLTCVLCQAIGNSWITHPYDLINLKNYDGDAWFYEKLREVKYHNKEKLADFIAQKYHIELNPESIFDVHVKRIHAYKRQLLNVFHIMDLYNRLKENPNLPITPRTFIFAGKAAPGYHMAKRIIKLINQVAGVINQDKEIQGKIKVVFVENYGVSLAEMIIPAADVSEQISTASKEASGTGNMKFMMNGAVTIGTLDGANIEMLNAVGNDNFIRFGLTAQEVLNYYQHGGYNAWDMYHGDSRIKTVLDQLVNVFFPIGNEEFRGFYDSLLNNNDEFFVLKDFASYVAAQQQVDQLYQDKDKWGSMMVNNIAHAGFFSSDRTIKEYAIDIWHAKQVPIERLRPE